MARRRGTRRLTVCLAALAALLTSLVTTPVSAQTTSTVTVRLRAAARHLQVHRHSHGGRYDRTKDFGDWLTQYGECDTRAVVLKQESLKRTTQNEYCTVERGKWLSLYDGRFYFNAYGGTVQVDHVVPVKNAWVSGAWRWTKGTRVRYYNDLGDPRTLVAVDAHDNEAKGDQDPSQWMPTHGRCRYIRYYVAVKTRWHLTVTRREKRAVRRYAGSCPNRRLRVRTATIRYR